MSPSGGSVVTVRPHWTFLFGILEIGRDEAFLIFDGKGTHEAQCRGRGKDMKISHHVYVSFLECFVWRLSLSDFDFIFPAGGLQFIHLGNAHFVKNTGVPRSFGGFIFALH